MGRDDICMVVAAQSSSHPMVSRCLPLLGDRPRQRPEQTFDLRDFLTLPRASSHRVHQNDNHYRKRSPVTVVVLCPVGTCKESTQFRLTPGGKVRVRPVECHRYTILAVMATEAGCTDGVVGGAAKCLRQVGEKLTRRVGSFIFTWSPTWGPALSNFKKIPPVARSLC